MKESELKALQSGQKFQVKKTVTVKHPVRKSSRWMSSLMLLCEQGLAVAWVCVGMFVGWISAVIYYRF